MGPPATQEANMTRNGQDTPSAMTADDLAAQLREAGWEVVRRFEVAVRGVGQRGRIAARTDRWTAVWHQQADGSWDRVGGGPRMVTR